ncbi:hypothetical protein LCGC14_2242350 [marine sediment metagenome]|uniref:Uncharacterized protein n=1 Tax=marine sediment metagenome TaxID=412755 RepID=A0A0F9D5A7_9ZZZZ
MKPKILRAHDTSPFGSVVRQHNTDRYKKGVIKVKKNARIIASMNKGVRDYLEKHYAGKVLYIPRHSHRATRKTLKDTIKVLRKNKFTDKDICKVMHIYPSWLVKIDKEG